MAKAHIDLGQYEEAMNAAEAAMDAYSLVASGLGEREELATRQEAHRIASYGIVAALKWRDEEPENTEAIERAFALSELGRGRRVIDAVANPGALARYVPDELRQRDRDSASAVVHARRRLLRSLAAEDREGARVARQALDDAWQTRHGIVSRVQREAGRVAAIVYPQPVKLATMQAHLESCCALLSIHVLASHVYAFLITKDDAQLVGLGPSDKTREDVRRYLRVASTPGMDDRALAIRLFERFVRPFEGALRTKTRLIVVGDGELSFLPFGALGDMKTKRRLIEQMEVVAAPSATTYDALLQRRPAAPGQGLIAVGDPAYPPGGPFEALPGSREEVAAVATAFPKDQQTRLLGKDATRQNLQKALAKRTQRLRAVHLACHARIDPARPRLSGLVLSGGEMFSLDDVFRTRIDTDLAVLSACDSARGRVVEGVGTQGFVRGLLFAGANQVVVANWRVADRSTIDLMGAFYRAMAGDPKRGVAPKSVSAALRAAKRERIEAGGKHAHPYYWASFVLWGLPD